MNAKLVTIIATAAVVIAGAAIAVSANSGNDSKKSVAVTMPWQKEMLDEITQGKTYDVLLLAREGYSVHDSIPLSVGDIVKLKNSKLWFTVGLDLKIEGEVSVYDQVKDSMGDRIINSSKGIDYIVDNHHHHGDGTVEARPLTEWTGEWQSMYPYVADNSLSAFIKHKAAELGKTVEETKTQYLALYNGSYNSLKFEGNVVSFKSSAGTVSSTYSYQEYRTATTANGIVAWYIYKNSAASSEAPKYISVNDHFTAIGAADEEAFPHFHMRYGDSIEAVTNPPAPWAPTFFKSGTTAEQMADVMIAHSASYNMHVWCSPANLSVIAANVKNALITADPEHSDIYENGYASYIAKINVLKARAASVLGAISGKEVMVWHGAWGYLFKPYGICEESLQEVVGHGVKDLTVANIMAMKAKIGEKGHAVIFASPHDLIMNNSYKNQLGIPVVEANPNSMHHLDAMGAFIDALDFYKAGFPLEE